MTWIKLDDQYPDHPKVAEVGPLGMALHTAALCYCGRFLTDGFVPTAQLAKLINLDGIYTVTNGVTNTVSNKELTDTLIRVGLFEAVAGGVIVHDYLAYNPPAEQVKAERAANAARQAAWKGNRKGKGATNGVANGVANGVSNGAITGAPYPYPDNPKGAEPDPLNETLEKMNDPAEKNKPAVVGALFRKRFGDAFPPEYGRLGKMAGALSGGYVTLAKMIWNAPVVEGNPHDYLQATVKKSKAAHGRPADGAQTAGDDYNNDPQAAEIRRQRLEREAAAHGKG